MPTRYASEAKRLRLQGLARMFTDNNDLVVRMHPTRSATDFRTMEIADDNTNGKGSLAMRWLARKKSVAHESGHLLYTRKADWKEALGKGKLVANIFNIIEDGRIERLVASAFPGTLLWFRVVNEYYFRKLPPGDSLSALLDALNAYAKAGIIHTLDSTGNEVFGKVKSLIDKALTYRTSRPLVRVSEEIAQHIIDAYPSPDVPEPQQPPGTSSPEKAPKNNKDHRRIRVVKAPQRPPDKDDSESSTGPSGTQEDDSSEGQNSQSQENKEEKDSNSPQGSDKDPQSSAKESSDPSEDQDNEPDGNADEESDSGESPSEDPQDPEDEADSNADEESDSGENPSEDSQDSENEVDSNADEESDSENSPGSGGESPTEEDSQDSGDDPGKGEPQGDTSESDENADDQSTGNPSGDPGQEGFESQENAPGGTEGGSSEGASEESSEESLGENEDEDEDEGEDFDAEASALLAAAADELDALSNKKPQNDAKKTTDDFDVPPEAIETEVSRGIHSGVQLLTPERPKSPYLYRDTMLRIKPLLRKTVDEIKLSLEYRPTIMRRDLRRGKLYGNALYKLATYNGRVFAQHDQPGDIPELAICCLVDCSYSMIEWVNGQRKIELARNGATLLHEACKELKVAHTVIGFSAHYPHVFHWRAVDWGEEDGSGITSLEPNRSNRDGYTLRAAAIELQARPEPDKLIIVLSDGLPNDKGYPWVAHGPADTLRTVRQIQRENIDVVGIYFGPGEHLDRAQRIYNNFVYAQKPAQLPAILGRVLRKIYT